MSKFYDKEIWKKGKEQINFIYFVKYIYIYIFLKIFIILYVSYYIDKCVRRSSLPKNAKKYNRFRNELHLDRGDFYIHVSGVQQTDWIPCEQFCSRRRVKRDKNRRSIFFKRGTIQYSFYTLLSSFFLSHFIR